LSVAARDAPTAQSKSIIGVSFLCLFFLGKRKKACGRASEMISLCLFFLFAFLILESKRRLFQDQE